MLKMIFRSPFQPQLFCDYMIYITSLKERCLIKHQTQTQSNPSWNTSCAVIEGLGKDAELPEQVCYTQSCGLCSLPSALLSNSHWRNDIPFLLLNDYFLSRSSWATFQSTVLFSRDRNWEWGLDDKMS